MYAYDEALDHSHENILVAIDPQGAGHDAVVIALAKAGKRFEATDETGTEHQTADSVEAAAMNDAYTPSFVSDPESVTGGVAMYLDCKGWVSPAMATTLKQILLEELERTGLELHVSVYEPN